MEEDIRVGDQVRFIGERGVVVDEPCTVLAIDPECPDLRGAAWIRQWPERREHPMYRSVDLSDLEPW
jgi:hypothetical protein